MYFPIRFHKWTTELRVRKTFIEQMGFIVS